MGINLWVIMCSWGKTFDSLDELPKKDVALVLGTSRSVDGRKINFYFKSRLQAAADIYKSNKVHHFILSGDNSVEGYNEPQDMKNALIDLGVPSDRITLDFAGFRTLDSVVRAKKVFGQKELCIISQSFHNPRALYLAWYHGLDAVAFDAPFQVSRGSYVRIIFREYLARVKAFLDLYILRTQPRFLGEMEKIIIK